MMLVELCAAVGDFIDKWYGNYYLVMEIFVNFGFIFGPDKNLSRRDVRQSRAVNAFIDKLDRYRRNILWLNSGPKKPRRFMMLVKAGAVVNAFIDKLVLEHHNININARQAFGCR